MEVADGGFPMTYEGPGVTEPMPGGKGVNKSAYRDERARQFFRQVDAAYGQIAAGDEAPLVVTGIDRNLAFFNEVSAHTDQIIATLSGSYDKASAHELANLVWPLAQSGLARRRQKSFGELDAAISAGRYASGIDQAWRAAREGRGETLLVEEGFHYPARLGEDGMRLTPADDFTGPDFLDDAVDELVEIVIAKDGRVIFAEDGRLTRHQRIALITRY
jgi:hypothetical protein